MKINIHAGHNPDCKIACGAVGLIKESTEARKVVKYVKALLRLKGHKVYDCTINDGTSQSDVLYRIISKCNKHKVDLDVSIHFNAGRSDSKGDGKNGGCEVCIYSNSSNAKKYAQSVCESIHKLGYNNRGIKVRTDLYYLSHTNAPAMLIECCFVDDKDDIKLYDYKKLAKAIVNGIIGK